MFQSTPKCPVDPKTRAWIERRMAWFRAQFGADGLRSRPVVLPNAEFFPDPYDGSDESVRVLFDRVCGYMGVRADQVEISLYGEQVPVQEEGDLVPGTGGLYVEADGRFHVWLNAANIDDPGGLVATMAHELGHVLLLGHRRLSPDEPDHEPLTDLLTVFLGLGVITANAVVHETSWTSGAWSGWSVGRRGYISMPMYGYALALFARERAKESPAWAKLLRPDVRQAFEQGCRYLESDERDGAGPDAPGSLPNGWAGASAPDSRGGAPEPGPDAVEDADDGPKCTFCGAELDEATSPEPVCPDCRQSMAANEQALLAARERDEADYQAKARVARPTCLVFAVACVALVLWQLIRAGMK